MAGGNSRLLKKTHMLRCAQSPRSNVLVKYASARRFFARLASEIFLSSLQEFSCLLLGKAFISLITFLLVSLPAGGFGSDKLVGIHSSRTMSQSMPWIAQEAGGFNKYHLDFPVGFIASSRMVTAAPFGSHAPMA